MPIRIKPLGGRFSIGNFDLEFVAIAHSIPEPGALAIRTPQGTVLHSARLEDRSPPGIPPIDEAKLRQIGDEGVDVLVCDTTNVLRDWLTRRPEADVAVTLDRIIMQARGRVAITTFASSVGRMLPP